LKIQAIVVSLVVVEDSLLALLNNYEHQAHLVFVLEDSLAWFFCFLSGFDVFILGTKVRSLSLVSADSI